MKFLGFGWMPFLAPHGGGCSVACRRCCHGCCLFFVVEFNENDGDAICVMIQKKQM